jgi:hypothetical protein
LQKQCESNPIPLFRHRKIQKEAGQVFLEKVLSVIENYQVELCSIGSAEENRAETSLHHRIRALLNCLIALIRCSIIPSPSPSQFFQVSHSKKMISDIMQRFVNTSQTLIGEQEFSLNLSH